MSKVPTKRCAIYTRKSTEEGLEQDFNSLDAQRESCEAYIASQASLGWKVSKTRYDDGGISGGHMDRPALQSLLDDVKAGRIDIIVVYKIDRLTRSLMDFAKLVDIFDEHDISFVSVTQAFNTTSSMGRLTLNVLLSFAQFEREVTAERIRDKFAASKKRGMWMGGPVPLGYDVKDRKLHINVPEAKTVRQLFSLYLDLKSVRLLKEKADELGIKTKVRQSQSTGRVSGGLSFSRGNLYQLLTNPIYNGKIPHKGHVYDGQHQAIIDDEAWAQAQKLISQNRVNRRAQDNSSSPHLLTGLLYDETGDRLSPTHMRKKNKLYHYYISHRLMQKRCKPHEGWRIPANQLEKTLLETIATCLMDPEQVFSMAGSEVTKAKDIEELLRKARETSRRLQSSSASEQKEILNNLISKITIRPQKLDIAFRSNALGTENREDETLTHSITLPHTIQQRSAGKRLIIGDQSKSQREPDQTLVHLVAQSFAWKDALTNGSYGSIADLADTCHLDRTEVSLLLPLAFLAPDIVRSILEGTQPETLTAVKLRRTALPMDWQEQKQLLGFPQ